MQEKFLRNLIYNTNMWIKEHEFKKEIIIIFAQKERDLRLGENVWRMRQIRKLSPIRIGFLDQVQTIFERKTPEDFNHHLSFMKQQIDFSVNEAILTD